MRTCLFAVIAITTFAAVVAITTIAAAVAAHELRTARRSSRDARWPDTAHHDRHHHDHHDHRPQPPATTTTTTTQGPPPGPPTTAGRQSSSSDQYHTPSSTLASSAHEGGGAAVRDHDLDHPHRQHRQHHQHHQQHQPVAVDASGGAADDGVYPETMAAPSPPSYDREIDRGGAWTADDKPWRTADDYPTGDDDRPTAPPRWFTQRLLKPFQNFATAVTTSFASNGQPKKYGPLVVETEVTTDNRGGGAVVHDSATGYSHNAVAYDAAENGYYNRQPVQADWYGGEAQAQAARPVVETVARPAPAAAAAGKTSFDLQKLSALALVKLGLIKVKLLAAIKFLALLAVKLKALTLFKVLLLAKLAVVGRLFNLFVLPFLPNVFTWLRDASLFRFNPVAVNGVQQQQTTATGFSSETATATSSQGGRNDSAPIEEQVAAAERSAAAAGPDHGPSSLAAAADVLRYVATARSAECVERLACRVAGTRPLSFRSVWVDWFLSSMANYIPNKKLKSYMSTFKDVSDYRLENIFTQPSTAEWLKQCDERYYCEEDSINNNII